MGEVELEPGTSLDLRVFSSPRPNAFDPLPETCRGVDVGRLRGDARRAYEMLLVLGRPRIAEFDRNLFRPVVYTAFP